MSTAFPLWPLFCLLLPLTWAGPLSTGHLTPTLKNIIPTCAQTCLDYFIAQNFPSNICGPTPDFECLCTSDSNSGFTIGEGALECLLTNCNNVYESEAVSVYDFCLMVSNAKPNTHGTLTATILTPTSSTGYKSSSQTSTITSFRASSTGSYQSSSSFESVLNTGSSINTVITTATSQPSFQPSTSSVEISTPTDPAAGGVVPPITPLKSSTASAASATAAAASSSGPVLTKPQVAGVVVASIGAAAIGLGICFLIFCLRRRRRSDRHRSDSSFGGDKIIGSEETTPDMAAISTRDFGYEHQTARQVMTRQQRSPSRQIRLETPASSSEDGWGHYQRDMAPDGVGLAVEPQMPRSLRDGHSPITPSSNRTRNSQLLPDKPTYSLFPPPLRVTPRNSVPNLMMRPPGKSSPKPAVPPLGSPFAQAAPPHPSSMDTSQTHLQGVQGGRSANPSVSDPFTDTSNGSAPRVYHQFQQSRPRPPPPSIRQVPPVFRAPSRGEQQSAGIIRKPIPSYQPPYKATIDNTFRRKPSRKKSNASRPMTYFSNGSETSFETLDDEDEPAPEPHSTLSPVAEVRSPPTGRIGYPAIPASVAESPTRRPREKNPAPAQPDSLLSKRLGQDKAKEIAARLHGTPRQSGDDHGPHSAKWRILVSAGMKGIEKPGSSSPPRSALKSPPPGQTPWRR